MKPGDTMFNKGRSGFMNHKMSMSDSSPGVDHREKSGSLAEDINGHLNQIRTSSEGIERPTVRSMKIFFETKVEAESTRRSASKITWDEEAHPLNVKSLGTISKEKNTPARTPFRVHPRQPAGKALSDLPLLHSVAANHGREQRAKVMGEVTTPQGLHSIHADQNQPPVPGDAPLALNDLNGVRSLGTAQDNPTTSAAVDANSHTDVSPAPIKPHINNLSLDLAFGPTFPPSPPLTPKTPKLQTRIDNSLRSTGLNTVLSQEAGGFRARLRLRSDSHSSPDAPSSPSLRHVRKNSVADKRTDNQVKETRNNTIEFLATLRETPVKVESHSNHIRESPPKSHISEVQELRDQLASTMRELQAAKNETLAYKNSVIQINKDLERLMKDLNATTDAHKSLVQRHERTKSELEMVREDFKWLHEEKREWQEQFDVMHHQVVQAERQIKCLDHLTKARFEARRDDVFGSPARTKKLAALSIDPSTKVVNAISSLNAEIQQLAKKIVENYLERAIFCPTQPESSVVVKAKKMLGEDLTQMLQAQLKMKTSTLHQLLVTIVLEIFLVRWCSSIIEGWYPERLSFSDLLAKLSSQLAGVSPSMSPTQCGKQMRVIETVNVASSEFLAWATDAFDDLSDILMIGGLSISSQGKTLSMMRDLFELAYDIRAALAEKDLCRVELVVVGPGTPFHPKWMDESHKLMQKGAVETLSKMEPIIGTTSVGLRRVARAAKNDEQSYLVKPGVVIARFVKINCLQ